MPPRLTETLPSEVREAADARTTVLQSGGRLPAKHVRTLTGSLRGIAEIRVSFDNNAYRVYFAAVFATALYILDAGAKKSPRDAEMPQWQVDRLVERMRQARDHQAQFAAALLARFDARSKARDKQRASADRRPDTKAE